MIVLFHCFANIFYWHWLKKYFTKTKGPVKEEETSSSSCTEVFKYVPPKHQDTALRCEERGLYFDPPLAKQRYARVTDILIHEKWRQSVHKIVEFGCASFQLFTFFKNTLQMQKLYFVDIDETLLRDSFQKLYPLGADFLSRRTQPLTIKVFCGSVTEPDPRLLNTDVVVAIELIEHLYPDVLEAVPYNIFSYINPRLVIITTPNSDFNPLFNSPERKFRHTDHKFEWSREQFQEWAANICARFPNYTVHFDGIGLDPEATHLYGCCSQLALFVKNDDSDSVTIDCDKIIDSISGSSNNHNLAEKLDFTKSSVAVEGVLHCRCKDLPRNACRNLEERESLRLCSCSCRECTPRNSYGICTYNSYVARDSYGCDFLSPEKDQENGPKEDNSLELVGATTSHSYCDFSYKNQNSLDKNEDQQSDDCSSIHTSLGPRQYHDRLYYKLIATIKYPFDVDTRTQEQKTLDEIRYRLRGFASVYSGFYDQELNRARVPIDKLICGKEGNFITESEMRAILLKHDFQIEECLVPGTDETETCVIYVPPDDMELSSSGGENDTSSSSAAAPESSTEASAGYESDNNVYPASEDECGWDEVDGIPEKSKEVSDAQPDQDQKQSQTPPPQQQPAAADSGLMDSGYQKSPLNEEPPVIPPPPPPKNYFDMFKDAPNEQNPLVPMNNQQMNNQQQSKSNRLSTILSVFEPFTPEKMNELDAIRKEKKFLNFASMAHKDAMKKLCQEIKHPVAGPSNVFKKKQTSSNDKKINCSGPTSPLAPLIAMTSFNNSAAAASSLGIESEANNPVEDAKSIANCILENSLNKIELNIDEDINNKEEEEENPIGSILILQNLDRVHHNHHRQHEELLIEDAAALAPVPVVNVAGGAGQIPAVPFVGPLQLLEAVAVVENGDLANNNRDGEGNNYPPDDQPPPLPPLAHNIEQFDPNNLPMDAPLLPNNIVIDNHNQLLLLNNMNVHQNNNNQMILLIEEEAEEGDLRVAAAAAAAAGERGHQQQQQPQREEEEQDDVLIMQNEHQSQQQQQLREGGIVMGRGEDDEERDEENTLLLRPAEFRLEAAPVRAAAIDDAEDRHREMALPLQQGAHHLPAVLSVLEATDPPDVVAWSSREALYDSNSQVDLLEDFDVDQAVAAVHLDEALALAAAPDFVVVAGNLDINEDDAVPMLPDESSFPHWLLQIFEEEEPGAGDDNNDVNLHDEPHFYCQGDGLGVHPSTVNLNNEDGDDEAETDDESDSSISGSADLVGPQNLDNENLGAVQGVARLPQNLADFGEEENNGDLAAMVLPNDEANSLEDLPDLAVIGQSIMENNRQLEEVQQQQQPDDADADDDEPSLTDPVPHQAHSAPFDQEEFFESAEELESALPTAAATGGSSKLQ